MGRKKDPLESLVVGMVVAPFKIAAGIGKMASDIAKESAKEHARKERLAKQEEARRIREENQRMREERRIAAELARQKKAEERARAQRMAKYSHISAKYAELEDRYGKAIRDHEVLERAIYSEERPDKIIAYCKEDIELIPLLYDYTKRKSVLEETQCVYPVYDTYLQLSMAYEELGKYDYAVLACQQAIDMGMTSGGADGTMQDRIERLTQVQRGEEY